MSVPTRIVGGVLAATLVTSSLAQLAVAPASADETASLPPLFVSEVLPDNGAHTVAGTPSTQDNFEFLEVTNTTDAPIDLATSGYTVSYKTVTLTFADQETNPAVVPADGSALLWVRYQGGSADGFSASSPNSFLFTDADFRAHHGVEETVPVLHVTGQNGLANSSTTPVPLTLRQGTTVVSASSYLTADVGQGVSAQFRVPAPGTTDAPVLAQKAAPSPGTVTAEQLTPSAPAPTEPPAPTTPEPTDPADPAEPAQPTEPSPTPGDPETSAPSEPGTSTPAEPEPSASAEPAAGQDLFISEIQPDNASDDGGTTTGTTNVDDTYEFVEITNTTDAAVNLADRGLGLGYATGSTPATAPRFALSNGVAGDAVTAGPLDVTVPANGSAVLWLEYATSATLDTYARTEADFRTFYGIDAAAPVHRIEGQAGIANGGDRTLSLVAGGTIAASSYLPSRTGATGLSGQFRVGTSAATAATFLSNTTPTPGSTTAEQLTPDTTTPTDPAEPTDPPTTSPPVPSVPEQPAPPTVDPALQAPLLQVTEVAPDTANVGGSDAYEFIELYNASQSPVRYEDFTINYLTIDASHVITNSALWPAEPADPVIAPGKTLVLWIKNGPNDALTAADFNAHFGSRLVAGTDLLEIHSGGMSNAGPRGVQVMTNTGHEISRADYMNDGQTVADQPIQYRWESGATQVLTGTGPATPGYAVPPQVPAGLVADPAADAPPVITDLRGGTEVPETNALELAFEVTDDHQVRSVLLTLDTDDTEPTTQSLRFDAPGRYGYSVPDVDLLGKEWVEYTLTARDGAHTVTHGPVRIDLQPGEREPVRLNVTEDQYVGGTTRLAATTDGDPSRLRLEIDGAAVAAPVPTLESAPVFAFEATNTDAFFRNGVKLGDEVLHVFDEGFYDRVVTVPAEVPVESILQGQPFTVAVWAGTKAWPEVSTDDNNDDFSIRNLRLALPDGRVLLPAVVGVNASNGAVRNDPPVRTPLTPTATTSLPMGDGANNYDYVEATFALPDDAFTSLAHVWDTTTVTDGAHVVSALEGDTLVNRTVRVDNTQPSITPDLEEGRHYRGPFTIDAAAADTGAGLAGESGLTATLDGTAIDLPHDTSSLTLEPGDHVAFFRATDRVGNTVTRTVSFTTGDESTDATLGGPDDGASVASGDVRLSATPTSPEGDPLTVRFKRGYAFDPADSEVESFTGTTADAAETERADRTLLSGADLARLTGADGVAHEVSSDSALPYQLFTVRVPADAGADAKARISWAGSANAGAKVLLYVRTAETGAWQEVDRRLTGDEATDFTLEAMVPLAGHVTDGKLTVLVQHSEGFAGADRSARDSAVAPYHPGATDRSQYDFTIGWQSDTQYYNENQGWVAKAGNPDTFYRHQRNINEFFVDQRDELNLQYVLHTGDIVDDAHATDFQGDNIDPEYEWKNADPSYRLLDEAGLPYGVLAGNHDVGHATEDFAMYSKLLRQGAVPGQPLVRRPAPGQPGPLRPRLGRRHRLPDALHGLGAGRRADRVDERRHRPLPRAQGLDRAARVPAHHRHARPDPAADLRRGDQAEPQRVRGELRSLPRRLHPHRRARRRRRRRGRPDRLLHAVRLPGPGRGRPGLPPAAALRQHRAADHGPHLLPQPRGLRLRRRRAQQPGGAAGVHHPVRRGRARADDADARDRRTLRRRADQHRDRRLHRGRQWQHGRGDLAGRPGRARLVRRDRRTARRRGLHRGPHADRRGRGGAADRRHAGRARPGPGGWPAHGRPGRLGSPRGPAGVPVVRRRPAGRGGDRVDPDGRADPGRSTAERAGRRLPGRLPVPDPLVRAGRSGGAGRPAWWAAADHRPREGRPQADRGGRRLVAGTGLGDLPLARGQQADPGRDPSHATADQEAARQADHGAGDGAEGGLHHRGAHQQAQREGPLTRSDPSAGRPRGRPALGAFHGRGPTSRPRVWP